MIEPVNSNVRLLFSFPKIWYRYKCHFYTIKSKFIIISLTFCLQNEMNRFSSLYWCRIQYLFAFDDNNKIICNETFFFHFLCTWGACNNSRSSMIFPFQYIFNDSSHVATMSWLVLTHFFKQLVLLAIFLEVKCLENYH